MRRNRKRYLRALVFLHRLSLFARMNLQKRWIFFWSLECWEVQWHILKQRNQQGLTAGPESKQMCERPGLSFALVHTKTDKHTHRRSLLIGSADKSQAGWITHEERLSFRLLRCRLPGCSRSLCVRGDSSLTTITKLLTSNNNPSLKSDCWSRSFQSRAVWAMLLLFFSIFWNCCMTKSSAQGSITFRRCLCGRKRMWNL